MVKIIFSFFDHSKKNHALTCTYKHMNTSMSIEMSDRHKQTEIFLYTQTNLFVSHPSPPSQFNHSWPIPKPESISHSFNKTSHAKAA